MPDNDVQPDSSAGDHATPAEPPTTDTSAVIDVAPEPADDRPLRNVVAEMNRKFEQTNKSIADLAACLAAFQPQPNTNTTYNQPARPPSDEELQQAYFQGNGQAGMELQRRVAERVGAQQIGALQRQQAVSSAIQTLTSRFPSFHDAASDLYNAAVRERQVLIASGAPNSYETTLEAMKLSIVNNPQLAVSQQPVTGELSRQSAVASHSIPEGTGQRRPSQPKSAPLSQDQLDLAKRMNAKDPAGAIKRLAERQAAGKSSVSPTISMMVKEF